MKLSPLLSEANSIHEGKTSAGWITEFHKLPDGTYQQVEMDPKQPRSDRSRSFKIRNSDPNP